MLPSDDKIRSVKISTKQQEVLKYQSIGIFSCDAIESHTERNLRSATLIFSLYLKLANFDVVLLVVICEVFVVLWFVLWWQS